MSTEHSRSTTRDDVEAWIVEALNALTLDEKTALVSGGGFWTTTAIPRIGLREITFSDGPAGVRGPLWDERTPSVSFPASATLAATWSPELARDTGAAIAAEARAKNVDVVLGPTVNLHRSPRGGRNFESFSEDPLLTAVLAVELIGGLQDSGVAASPKHFVGNDIESDRMSVSVDLDERALRELYLRPFESAVTQAGAWSIMTAYNSVNGVTMTEHPMLDEVLAREWGFDGVVVSDWSAVRSIASANAGQHLAMPGPNASWGSALKIAVETGVVPRSVLDEKVSRVLRLAWRVGAWRRPSLPAVGADAAEVAGRVARSGIVLLRNENHALPLDGPGIGRVAVIGYRARFLRTQGGGSATVVPQRTTGLVDSLRTVLPDVTVDEHLGGPLREALRPLPSGELSIDGQEGLRVRYIGPDGATRDEHRLSTELIWLGNLPDPSECERIQLDFVFTPSRSESVEFGVAATGHSVVEIDGEIAADRSVADAELDEVAALMTPPEFTVARDLRAGHPVAVRVTHFPVAHVSVAGSGSLIVGTRPLVSAVTELLDEAVRAAAGADAVIVVVGTTTESESEGRDRAGLRLDPASDRLVRAIASVNNRTIVVINSGAPVLLPWRDEVAAILHSGFGGQELGAALADVMSGRVAPRGRLASTWPADERDAYDPVLEIRHGRLADTQGALLGYRAPSSAPPAYPFGHGLGFTVHELSDLRVTRIADGTFRISVDVSNIGEAAGRAVPQVYFGLPGEPDALVGFGSVDLSAGAVETVQIDVPRLVLRRWNVAEKHWSEPAGPIRIRVAQNASDPGIASIVENTPAEVSD